MRHEKGEAIIPIDRYDELIELEKAWDEKCKEYEQKISNVREEYRSYKDRKVLFRYEYTYSWLQRIGAHVEVKSDDEAIANALILVEKKYEGKIKELNSRSWWARLLNKQPKK